LSSIYCGFLASLIIFDYKNCIEFISHFVILILIFAGYCYSRQSQD
jgi:hypothetical protein